MATATRSGMVNFDEFSVLIKPHQKADLIDAVVYMASPENIESYQLFLWLIRLMVEFVEDRDLGEVFGSRIAFRMNKKQGPEPDIAFVSKQRLHLVRKTFIEGAPDLAIEIVSPDSVERDYVKKRAIYEQGGVSEYWIIDEDLQRVTLLRLDRNGRYREIRPVKGVLQSRTLPGFWLRPDWLWKRPRPRTKEILAEIDPSC
jgi:Uma2 family endonuclease